MANLTPVDNDPFATDTSAPATGSPTLTPVDHDPFAADTSAQPSTPQRSPGEEFARQLGLTGRYMAGAVPEAVSGTADMLNTGINAATGASNKYLGTNIPPLNTNLTSGVERGLNAMGYPQPETPTEQNVGTASKLMTGAVLGGEGTVNSAKQAAQTLGDMGSSAAAPFKTMKAGYNAMSPEELAQTAQDMKSGAGDVYSQMRAAGATFNPDKIEGIRNGVNNALANKDILPQLTPVTSSVVQGINDAADSGTLSLNHMDQYRRMLRDASGEDSAAAGAVRNAIDTHVNATTGDDLTNGDPQAVALLNRGRAEYSRAAAFDDVGTILQKTNGNPTKIKTALTNFLAKDQNTMGLTDTEIAALRRASQTSSGEAMAGMLGKAGFTIFPTGGSGNGVLPYVISAGEIAGKGAGTMVPGGLPLVAAGTVAKAGNTLYGRGLAQQALDTIANRPLPPMPEGVSSAESLALPPPATQVPPGGFTPNYEGVGPDINYNAGQKALPAPKEMSYEDMVKSGRILQQPGKTPVALPGRSATTYNPNDLNAGDEVGFQGGTKPINVRPNYPAGPRVQRWVDNPATDAFSGLQDTSNIDPGPSSAPTGQFGIDRMYRAQGGRIRSHSGPVFAKPRTYAALSKGKTK